ncbi:MAG: hypothetical protein LBT45_00750 [Rickettsiales bacterium]|jgi:hypothetical protein|nr:hypothetical protein [Rickettsiales bacterium]
MKESILFVLVFIFALIVITVSAEKLCQLDWLAAWKNLGDSKTLSNGEMVKTMTYGSQSEVGMWAVASDEGSPGVKHTVNGISQCSNGSAYVGNSSTGADNRHCWCRMTSPNLGKSWVFLYSHSSAAYCAYDCADVCANCVLGGAYYSCSRSAVLALL